MLADEILTAYHIRDRERGVNKRTPYELCIQNAATLIQLLHPLATMIISKEGDEVRVQKGVMNKAEAGFDVIQWLLNEFGCPKIPVLYHIVLHWVS